MATHKYIDRVCVAVILFAILITVIFMNSGSLGVIAVSAGAGYTNRLFDTSRVHTIDIVMEDWEDFIGNCESEEYSQCAVVIDGEESRNVGIRAKGNTSLSNVSAMGSERYSFKVEFDHYDSTQSYFGLDKLSLNNLIQDTTYMKDYLTYQMMGSFGVDAPLCSYAYLTVNGEDWGLYLAVEGVEEAFLQRNYGSNYGKLYKPDSSDFGGGPGNGRGFRMDEFMESDKADSGDPEPETDGGQGRGFSEPEMREMPAGGFPGAETGEMPAGGFSGAEMGEMPAGGFPEPEPGEIPGREGGRPEFGKNPGQPGGDRSGGMGSSDVKLQYIDDNPDSYPNIFDNAKTEINNKDKTRLISSLKALGEGEGIEEVVNVEEVIRYFVVHNFVCNGDSYTGSIVHNYYLYEEDGQLSMIPWDYNLAFGTFQAADATSMVNSPIDTPVTDGSRRTGGKGNPGFPGARGQEPFAGEAVENEENRPMVDWIFAEEAYTEQYHQYFAEFLESMDFERIIEDTAELIAPYVKKDPTGFYSYEEFEAGVSALKEFCSLRKESVKGQLSGQIPATDSGQAEDPSALVDAFHLDLSDMGSMEKAGMDTSMENGKINTFHSP